MSGTDIPKYIKEDINWRAGVAGDRGDKESSRENYDLKSGAAAAANGDETPQVTLESIG